MTHANPLNLYLGENTDYKGRTLKQILEMDDSQLERTHDYIQVLFPGTRISAAVPNSPVLLPQTISDIRSDPEVLRYVQSGLLKSLDRMLSFYGLHFDRAIRYVFMDVYRDVDWRAVGNHNAKRIARIIACLRHFALFEEANAFSYYLKLTLPTHPSGRYWGYDNV